MSMHLEDLREDLLDARVEGRFAVLRDHLAQDDELLLRVLPSIHTNIRWGQSWHVFATAVVHLLDRITTGDGAAARAIVSGAVTMPARDVYAQLRALCFANLDALCALLARPNQTSAPERAAVFYPALCDIARQEANASLRLLEIGPGMGFNLCVDRFRYDYGALGQHGDAASPCSIPFTIELRPDDTESDRAAARSMLSGGFDVAARVGLELTPVDLDDPAALAWHRSFLVRPERNESGERHVTVSVDAALQIRRQLAIEIVAGDVAKTLEPSVSRLQQHGVVCVLESYAAYQLPSPTREHVLQVLTAAGMGPHPVYLLSLGRFTPRGGRLSIFRFHMGRRERRTAGYVNGFGNVGDTLTWFGGRQDSLGSFSGDVWRDCPL